jgi:hypothetical protein
MGLAMLVKSAQRPHFLCVSLREKQRCAMPPSGVTTK